MLQALPRTRQSSIPHEEWKSRRSERLAAKSVYRDPHPERQARRVLLNKWAGPDEAVRPDTPDPKVAARFQEAFGDHVPSERRDSMLDLFPLLGSRAARCASRAT